MNERLCTRDDCARKPVARGLCHAHYCAARKRQLRGTAPPWSDVRVVAPDRGCSVDGCPAEHLARGLCKSHYQKQRRRTRAEQAGRQATTRRSSRGVCDRDGCGRPVRSRGLCTSHYAGREPSGKQLRRAPERSCANCGDRFAPTAYGAGLVAAYCTWACRAQAKSHERRALAAQVPSEPIRPADVFERDKWVCQLCGADLDRAARHPHPQSPSLDHIVPVIRGGPHLWDNVQASHLRCNIAKGARPAPTHRCGP